MSFFKDVLSAVKKVPVLGTGVSLIDAATSSTSIQEEVYAKLVRIINAGGLAIGVMSAPLAALGLTVLNSVLTSTAADDGSLHAEIMKLSDKDAWAIFGMMNAHPGLAIL